ncbi:MAG: glycosyltransferase family 2 protein [Calditrichaeota bacterium]|nr:MAG: glycosyltransferase family 2 protein [Calditrichota bacterium]
MSEKTVSVIIPAHNEEQAIGKVVSGITSKFVKEIIVVNNASTDQTAEVARKAGAKVVDEPKAGYGMACLTGIASVDSPEIVLFIDGDASDDPKQIDDLVLPILKNEFDFVIGSRKLGKKEEGSLTPQQAFGNWLAVTLIKLFWGFSYTDLGPFRAIRYSALQDLEMKDTNYGWTVEMQIKAVKQKLRIKEIPANYFVRIGFSKISGTVKGVISAGFKIIYTIFKSLKET